MTYLRTCRHCFGFRPDVQNSVHWLEGALIAYPVGHNVVVMDTETKQQKFIPCAPESAAITALAVSPNLKQLAVAEAAPKASVGAHSTITVYDLATLKRRKTLAAPETGSPEVVDLSFSADSRLLLAQGGAPEWSLVLWVWEKARVASVLRAGGGQASVLSAQFCPSEAGLIALLGPTSVKIVRSADNNLKTGPQPLTKRDAQEYTCQAWVADGERERLAVGCLSGEILLIEGIDLKAVMHTEGNAPVDCILPWSKGFMVGQNNGAVAIFERDERESYRRTKVFRFPEPSKVVSMSLSSHEAHVAVAVKSGRIYTLPIGNLEILKPDEDNFELLGGVTFAGFD